MNKKNLSLGLLRQKRELLGLSMDDVVQKLNDRGIKISSKTLYGYENGVGFPKVNTFIALCDIYGIDDILGAFGVRSNVKLATGEVEWPFSLYNDFFNASLLDKIYILLTDGVPSFDGYEAQLRDTLPDGAITANFNKLWNCFSKLNESGQSQLLEYAAYLVSKDKYLEQKKNQEKSSANAV